MELIAKWFLRIEIYWLGKFSNNKEKFLVVS